MLKCDFHMHSCEDPYDVLDYDAFELIDHAARLNYQVLSLTLHGRCYAPQALQDYSRSKGILFIPGIEIYLEGKEVLLINPLEEDLKNLRTFNDLRKLRKRRFDDLLVIAPHPFYVLPACLGKILERHADVFDAVEFCHFYTENFDLNRKGKNLAESLGKTWIATSDTHRLRWMGHHYTWIDAQPTIPELFASIRKGKIKNISRPLTSREALQKLFYDIIIFNAKKVACDYLRLIKRKKGREKI